MMKRRYLVTFLLYAFAVTMGVMGFLNQEKPFANPFQKDFHLELPSFATMDLNANVYVIDNSLSRIRKIGTDGSLIYEIGGANRNLGKLFYGVELAVDSQGYLYVINQVMQENGFYTEREDILRYDPAGQFDRIVHSRQYKPEEITNNNVTRGRVIGLSLEGKRVFWHELSDRGVIQSSVNIDTWRLEQNNILPIEFSAIYVASVARIDDHSFAYTTKRGELFRVVEGQPPMLLYSGDDNLTKGGLSVPWWIGVDHQKRILFSDLTRSEIRRMESDGTISLVLSNALYEAKTQDKYAYVYYVFSVGNDGRLVTINDINVLSVAPGGELDFILSGGYFPFSILLLRLLLWMALFALIAAVIMTSVLIYQDLLHRRISLIVKQLFILLPSVTIILAFVAYTLINYASVHFESLTFSHISQTIQVISQKIDTDRLENVRLQKDFMSDDYRYIRHQLHSALNYNKDPWNNKFYFVLHRIYDGKIYSFMYLNDQITSFHPFAYLNDPNLIYWKANRGEIATTKVPDPWGTWILGVGPVYNKEGKIAAILEVGRDLYGFQQETNKVLGDMVPYVLAGFAILIIVFFLFTWLILAPLRTLRSGVAQIASGRWDTSLPIKGHDEVADLTLVFNKMAAYIRNYIDEIIALSQGYRRFVPQEFLTHLQKESVKEVHLGDQIQREMSIMFTDIRSFTSLSESMSPKENFDFLNSYLRMVGPEVRKHQGFIDKYIGDAIMALFPNSPDDAIGTSIEIIGLLHEFNTTQKERGLHPISIGIGIHTGTLMLGILGEEERMDSTVISDNVNLASRLEGLTKFFDSSIIISETSLRGVRNKDRYLFRYLGKVKVKGKKEPIGIYEILDGMTADVKNKKIKTQDHLEEGIRQFQAKNFVAAQAELTKALTLHPDDTPVKVYLSMCRQALASGIPDDWTGAITMSSK